MVDLTTQAPEVRPQNVNVLLGSFQREKPSQLGAVVEGVNEGIRTKQAADRAAQDDLSFDPDLFLELSGVNQGAVTDLETDLGKIDSKSAQTGSRRDLTPDVRVAMRRAIARDVPVEVVMKTLQNFNSVKNLFGKDITSPEEEQRASEIKFLEQQGERYQGSISIFDMNDAELSAFARQIEDRESRIKNMRIQHETLKNSDEASAIRLRTSTVAMMPDRIQKIQSQVNGLIVENADLFNTQGVRRDILSDEETVRLQLATENLTSIRAAFRNQTRRDLGGAPTEAQLNAVNAEADVYFDQIEAVLSGTSRKETLQGIADLSTAVAENKFYQDNPLARQAQVAATELKPLFEAAGFLGFADELQFTKYMLLPALQQSVANLAAHMDAQNMPQEDQEELYGILTRYLTSPTGDPETKQAALTHTLSKMLKGGEDDSGLYHAMLDLLADPKTVNAVKEGIGGLPTANLRRSAVLGLANYVSDVQDDFRKELAIALTQDPVFTEQDVTIDMLTEDQKVLARRFGSTGPLEVFLDDFVEANLTDEGTELNLMNLEQLSEKERTAVIEHYRRLRREFADPLTKIDNIRRNYTSLQEQFVPEVERQEIE